MPTKKKAAKAKASTRTQEFEFDAEEVGKAIVALEGLKKMAEGDRALDMVMNLGRLRRIQSEIQETLESKNDRFARRDRHGKPIPVFVPVEHGPEYLDESRYDGQWQEGEYAPGRIVVYSDGFYEAEDVTDEKPPGTTWARIGHRGRNNFVDDFETYQAEVKAIQERKHTVELYMIPVAAMRKKGVTGDMMFEPIIDFGE